VGVLVYASPDFDGVRSATSAPYNTQSTYQTGNKIRTLYKTNTYEFMAPLSKEVFKQLGDSTKRNVAI
jgi:hypothetical protein